MPVRGFPSEYILLCRLAWKNKNGVTTRWWKILMLCLFVLTQSTNVTDRHTHRDTAWRHRRRLCIASRGKNAKKNKKPLKHKNVTWIKCKRIYLWSKVCRLVSIQVRYRGVPMSSRKRGDSGCWSSNSAGPEQGLRYDLRRPWPEASRTEGGTRPTPSTCR